MILFTLVSCSTISIEEQNQIKSSALLLGDAYSSKGSYSEALKVYDQALAVVSDYRLNYNKAATLAHLGRYEEAMQLCQMSFDIYPDIISFKKLELSILQICGSSQSVIDCCKQILAKDPADTETALILMKTYSLEMKQDEAYSVAVDLFNRKVLDNTVLTVLYNYDSESWKEVYNLFFKTTEE